MSERYRRSKKNGVTIKFKKESRLSNRREKVLELLSQSEHADGLTTKEIIFILEPKSAKIYDENKKLRRTTSGKDSWYSTPSEYKSWYRTLSDMVDMNILTKSKQKTNEILWKKAP